MWVCNQQERENGLMPVQDIMIGSTSSLRPVRSRRAKIDVILQSLLIPFQKANLADDSKDATAKDLCCWRQSLHCQWREPDFLSNKRAGFSRTKLHNSMREKPSVCCRRQLPLSIQKPSPPKDFFLLSRSSHLFLTEMLQSKKRGDERKKNTDETTGEREKNLIYIYFFFFSCISHVRSAHHNSCVA